MIRILLVLLLALMSSSTGAQIKKHTILLGAGGYFYNDKNTIEGYDYKYVGGDYSVSVGTAFKENSVAGVNIHYRPIRQKDYLRGRDTINVNYDWVEVGGFLREYRKIAKDFYFFCQADAGVVVAKYMEANSYATDNVNFSQWGASISLTPGISYQAFRKMQIEIMIPNALDLQYLMTKYDTENPQYKNLKRQQVLLNAPLFGNANGGSVAVGFFGFGFRFTL
jgi:hypothetical protein